MFMSNKMVMQCQWMIELVETVEKEVLRTQSNIKALFT